MVAGQSYAAGANDELLRITDPQERVSAYDWNTKTWRVANDPQPHVGDGGTIWPALGDLLVPMLRVPVGFVNVAVSATSTRQWMPDGEFAQTVVTAGNNGQLIPGSPLAAGRIGRHREDTDRNVHKFQYD